MLLLHLFLAAVNCVTALKLHVNAGCMVLCTPSATAAVAAGEGEGSGEDDGSARVSYKFMAVGVQEKGRVHTHSCFHARIS